MTASEPAKARAAGKKVAAPTAFIGIENPNEFFTHHYLTAILQGELRPVLERWRDASKTSESGATKQLPPQAFSACQQDFFRYLDRLEQQKSPEVRATEHFEMYCELLALLGYSDILSHRIGTLPAGHVPLYGEVKQADGSPLLWILPVVPAQGYERGTLSTVEYLRKVKKQKVFGDEGENEQLAEQLSRDCLRYMYRLLFLFYIEARPELGYAPIGEDAYRKGYSLERLRSLEQLDLSTEEARNGTYIHQSLRLLFDMIYDGRRPIEQEGMDLGRQGASSVSR